MGGFLTGMTDGFNTMQQLNHQKQVKDMFETLNQNWLGREDPNMQGPMPQMGGQVSLGNRMMGGMRQMATGLGYNPQSGYSKPDPNAGLFSRMFGGMF